MNHGEEGKARGETTTPKLEEVSIRLFPVYTYPKTTQEIIDFSGVDIMGWLSSEIGDAFVDTEEADLASGDGVKKRRVFSYPLSPDGDKTRPFGTIQKVTVSVLNADFLIDLKFKLRAKYRKNAVWVTNSTTAASVQKLKNGNGDYIWRDRLQAGDPDTLLGLPVEYLETMPDDLIGIGDFKRGYFIVDHETGTRTRPDNITEPGFIKIHTDKYRAVVWLIPAPSSCSKSLLPPPNNSQGFGPFLVFMESVMDTVNFEIRTSELIAKERRLVGYAVRWNSLSEIICDEFREQFTPGAFAGYLASGNDVRCLFEHDYTQLLGRTRSGTLILSEDDTGLRFELTPPNTQLGNDVLELVERGDIEGMSFGFRALKENWDITQSPYLRIVTAAELREITITSLPAYPESGVEIAHRSLYSQYPELRRDGDNRRRWAELVEI